MDLISSIKIIGRFTNSAILSPNDSYFSDESSTFLGMVKTNINKEIAFFDQIASFSKIINLFTDPSISIEGTKIKLEEGDSEAYFLTSDSSLIRQNINIKEQIERSLQAPQVLNMDIDESLVTRIKTASAIIENSSLILESTAGKVYLIVKDIDVLSSDSHSLKIDVTSKVSEVNEDFKIEMDASIMSRMPKGVFNFSVRKSQKNQTYRNVVVGDSLTIVMATNVVED